MEYTRPPVSGQRHQISMNMLFQESNKAADDDRELELEIERELEEEMRNNAEMKFKEQQALLMKEKEDVSAFL